MQRIGYYLVIFCCCFWSNLFAEDLEQIYQLAIKNDQTFQNATALRQDTSEALPQALSVLFPLINGTATTAMNRVTTTNSTSTNGLAKYNTHGYTLNLSMPIINFNDWYLVGQAKAQAKQADADYATAAQSLIIRTAQAYFNVLKAEDTLRIDQAKKKLLATQLAQSTARYQVGVDPMTTVYNARAAYDGAVAAEINDKNGLYTAYLNLQVITGKPINQLTRLIDNLPLQPPVPTDLNAWQKAAETRNFSLLSLRFAADAARQFIHANQANQLPNLSTVNSYEFQQTSSNPNTVGLETQRTTITGLQLSVPIFQGGEVLSQTRQAQARYVEAMTNLELQRRQTLANTFQTYNSVLSGISQIEADRATIKSNNEALESNQASYQAGTMTIVDVLTAINNLYSALQTFSADQYTYLENTLTLKQLAGNLSNLDIAAINQWLTNGNTISESEIKQALSKPTGVIK